MEPVLRTFLRVPPVTRSYIVVSTVVTIMWSSGYFEFHEFLFSWSLIFRGEWWRLVIPFLFHQDGIQALVELYVLYVPVAVGIAPMVDPVGEFVQR